MLSKKKRVTRKLFNEIIETGKTFSTPFFVFRYFYNKNTPRYTFVIPKKIVKKAVNRNKIKRKGFNIIRELPISNSSGIFFYKKTGIEKSSLELKEDIVFILQKTKIL